MNVVAIWCCFYFVRSVNGSVDIKESVRQFSLLRWTEILRIRRSAFKGNRKIQSN